MLTIKQQNELLLGFRRGNEALLSIVRAKSPRDSFVVGACLAARARARIVLAALEAEQFFTVWCPIWQDRAIIAEQVGKHERAAYYRTLANGGRDAIKDAREVARGDGLHKVIIWLDDKPII